MFPVLSRLSAFIWVPFLLFTACGGGEDADNAVARVYDNYLSQAELREAIPYGLSATDSAAWAKEYIAQWARKQLLIRQAENNLTAEQLDVSQQLEDYRASLLIYAYERELVRQKLDTIVSEAEIEAYYKNNLANFQLKNSIIRLRYLKLPGNSPNAEKAGNWFRSNSDADRVKLEQYCQMYAVNYLLNDNNWLLFQDVLKEIPIQDYSAENFQRNQRYLDIKDKDYRYFVSISGFLIETSNAPLSFERENIRNIILNKRKIKLVETMQLDLYNDALNEKNVEILKP